MPPQVFEKAVNLLTAAFPPSRRAPAAAAAAAATATGEGVADDSGPPPKSLFAKVPGSDVRALVQNVMPVLADHLVRKTQSRHHRATRGWH